MHKGTINFDEQDQRHFGYWWDWWLFHGKGSGHSEHGCFFMARGLSKAGAEEGSAIEIRNALSLTLTFTPLFFFFLFLLPLSAPQLSPPPEMKPNFQRKLTGIPTIRLDHLLTSPIGNSPCLLLLLLLLFLLLLLLLLIYPPNFSTLCCSSASSHFKILIQHLLLLLTFPLYLGILVT